MELVWLRGGGAAYGQGRVHRSVAESRFRQITTSPWRLLALIRPLLDCSGARDASPRAASFRRRDRHCNGGLGTRPAGSSALLSAKRVSCAPEFLSGSRFLVSGFSEGRPDAQI